MKSLKCSTRIRRTLPIPHHRYVRIKPEGHLSYRITLKLPLAKPLFPQNHPRQPYRLIKPTLNLNIFLETQHNLRADSTGASALLSSNWCQFGGRKFPASNRIKSGWRRSATQHCPAIPERFQVVCMERIVQSPSLPHQPTEFGVIRARTSLADSTRSGAPLSLRGPALDLYSPPSASRVRQRSPAKTGAGRCLTREQRGGAPSTGRRPSPGALVQVMLHVCRRVSFDWVRYAGQASLVLSCLLIRFRLAMQAKPSPDRHPELRTNTLRDSEPESAREGSLGDGVSPIPPFH
jgi:hypothetical protein